jgi:hypothetical protein
MEETMSYRSYGLLTAMAALAVWTCAAPAQALTMQECSAKYKAAQTSGTLGGVKWNDFRKAQCGTDAAAAPAAAPAVPAATTATAPKPAATRASARAAPNPTTTGSAPAATPAFAGNATFPTAVSAKYASMSAGKARMQTCLDQYNANKADNGNGSLKWIQKGGGYYSECNKRLSSR